MSILKQRVVPFVLGAAALPVALLLLAMVDQWRGIDVSVSNESGSRVTDIAITLRGKCRQRDVLGPGAKFKTKVRADTESGLEMSWARADGTRVKRDIPGYIEPGNAGTIDITLQPDGSCTSVDGIRLRWWWTAK